jgi:hypothetical protein
MVVVAGVSVCEGRIATAAGAVREDHRMGEERTARERFRTTRRRVFAGFLFVALVLSIIYVWFDRKLQSNYDMLKLRSFERVTAEPIKEPKKPEMNE